MKTITNSLKVFALLMLMMSVKSGLAQCSVTLTATQGTNGIVNFVATSSPTTLTGYYYWSFGSTTYTTASNTTSHTYTANGSYTAWVMFMAVSNCSTTASQTVVVTSVNNNTCVANPTYDLVPSGTAQLWYGLVSYANNVTAAQWSWGDGSTSTGLYPSHQYTAAGNYSICLTVTVACGTSSTYCSFQNIYKGGSANMVNVNIIDAATVGLANIKNQDVKYTVSPNPGNGLFEISMNGLNSNTVKINVTDIVGKNIASYDSEVSNNSIQKSIDLRSSPQGIYFINVTSEGQTYTKKIVVNK